MPSKPDVHFPAGTDSDIPNRRGFLLTLWLTLLSAGSLASAYYAVTETPEILEAYPDAPAVVLWSKTVLAVINVVLLGGIWLWKRWALYALGASIVAIFMINAIANQEWLYYANGLIGYGILLLLIRLSSSWTHFRPTHKHPFSDRKHDDDTQE